MHEQIAEKQLQLILISWSEGKNIVARHHFKAVAINRQPVALYTKWRMDSSKLPTLARVGGIAHTSSLNITREELATLAPGAEIITYASSNEAFMALIANEVDAVSLIASSKLYLQPKWQKKFTASISLNSRLSVPCLSPPNSSTARWPPRLEIIFSATTRCLKMLSRIPSDSLPIEHRLRIY